LFGFQVVRHLKIVDGKPEYLDQGMRFSWHFERSVTRRLPMLLLSPAGLAGL